LYFNWRNFRAFARRALRPPLDSAYRLTFKRAIVLAGFFGLFGATELTTRIAYRLDELIHPGYRGVVVRAPVFVIGNPRSGTTLLHRILAQDTATFTTMHLWEILFAPAILQRQVIRALAGLDGYLGHPLRRALALLDTTAARHNAIHDAGLLAPEEDQFLLVHIWSTLAIWHISGILEEAGPYTYFDTAVPAAEKRTILAFYKQAIRRHLYADRLQVGRPRRYLAKNPSASPKVGSLIETFPDAHFVYLVRTPLEMIPSMISCLDLTWRLLGDPPKRYAARDYVLDMAKHWYTYPLDCLAQETGDNYVIIDFDTLTRRADVVIETIYTRFGLTVDDAFARLLKQEAQQARAYRSDHHYDLAAMGLTQEMIVAEFGEVFDRFGFDRGDVRHIA
jgi:hypothetical protein